MLKRIAILVLASLTLAACGPSPEARAQAEQRRKEECLNKICPGDVLPQLDTHLEAPFKRNGRWFIVPRAYDGYDGRLAFYWPSKTPMTGRPDRGNYPERGQEFYKVAIEFFVEAMPLDVEAFDIIKKAEAENRIVYREKIRPELERIGVKEAGGRPNGIGTYYIASLERTPSDQPPVLYCDESNPKNGCGMHFKWKPGLRIYIRFNQQHGRDWPEIYQEVVRVLNLVKEI